MPPGASTRTPAKRNVHVRINPVEVQRATVRILAVISAWLLTIIVVGVARHFLFLILLAWLVAIAGEPAIDWLINRGRRRGVATAIVGGLALVALIGLFVLFGRAAFTQASQLISQGPELANRVVAQLNDTFGLSLDPAAITSSLQLQSTTVQSLAADLGGGVLGVVGSLASVVVDLITVIVFAFYIAGAGPGLVRRVAVWMPEERQIFLGDLWQIATEKTGGYVASKLVLATLSSIAYGTFFWIINLPGWLPLGLLVGITAQFLPLIGTYIGIAAPVLVALADKPVNAVWIVVFAVIYQQIETYLFTPKVAQRTMDVNPAITLAAVFLGAAIWGPIGAIIGVPIVAVAVALLENYGPRHELSVHLEVVDDPEPEESAAQPPRQTQVGMMRRLFGARPAPARPQR